MALEAPSGPASSWECRAAQSRQARPEEAREPTSGTGNEGALRPSGPTPLAVLEREAGLEGALLLLEAVLHLLVVPCSSVDAADDARADAHDHAQQYAGQGGDDRRMEARRGDGGGVGGGDFGGGAG